LTTKFLIRFTDRIEPNHGKKQAAVHPSILRDTLGVHDSYRANVYIMGGHNKGNKGKGMNG